jgi:chaperone modulatory protein CbpM
MSTHDDGVANEAGPFTLEHLAATSGLSIDELHELIDCGVIVPAAADKQPVVFQMHYVIVARTARRLRDDFELNVQGMALALNLLRRIESLEQALNNALAVQKKTLENE